MPAVKRSVALTDAAHSMGLSYQRVHRLVLLGVLRGIKQNGRWLVDVDDVRRVSRSSRAAKRLAASGKDNRR